MRSRSTQVWLGSAAAVTLAASTLAQPQADMNITAPKVETPPAELLNMPAPDSEEMAEYRQFQKRRVDLDKQLKKIRATYFRNIRNVEIRQAGIERLRDFTDAASFPSMLDIFRREGDDVREAILDHLAEIGTDESDGTLAWTAVFDDDKAIRESAARRLEQRCEENGKASDSVLSVVAVGLRQERSDEEIGAAAQLANMLRIYDAIPMMINAQVRGGGSGPDRGTGALAYILVGTQQAFISDLTPVVADSAVGFDPTVSIITEGVILRVIDAAVVTYHMDVHYSLTNLARQAGGPPPRRFGFDNQKWKDWYADEFLPYRQTAGFTEAMKAQAGQGRNRPAGGG